MDPSGDQYASRATLEDKLNLGNNAESSPLNPEFSGDGSFSSVFSNTTNESNKALDDGAMPGSCGVYPHQSSPNTIATIMPRTLHLLSIATELRVEIYSYVFSALFTKNAPRNLSPVILLDWSGVNVIPKSTLYAEKAVELQDSNIAPD